MRDKSEKKGERNNPADTKVSEEGEGGGGPGTGADIPQQPMMKQVVTEACGEHHIGADTYTAARGGPHAGSSGYALKEAAAHGQPLLELFFLEGL